MSFTSWSFAALCLLTLLFYYLPWFRRGQVGILLLASGIFYGANAPWLLLLLLFSILLNGGASYLVATRPGSEARGWALAGVTANLALLIWFKYAGLLSTWVASCLGASSATLPHYLLQIPLPIGISFYTFEGISLLCDVWKGKAEVKGVSGRAHLQKTALFIAFFPHLVAGPILKAAQFYPQIGTKLWREIPWETAFRHLVTGYFLKMVVADNLKDQTYWVIFHAQFDTLTNLTLVFGYSMQIFADFAGYSAIAIGLAALFGYTLPENFNRPYLARSLAEFWKRWHISLSTWLRDYLYFPLGGNRGGLWRTCRNLLIVMLLGGLWHGASWNYLLWGGYHGVGLVLERLLGGRETADRKEGPWMSLLRMTWVFTFVSMGWLCFMLPHFYEVRNFLTELATFHFAPSYQHILSVLLFSLPVIFYHLLAFPWTEKGWSERYLPGWLPVTARTVAYGVMLALLVLNSGSSHAFIYFQF